MYPEPPLLIRRALESDELPPGSGGPDGLRPKITRGADLFLAVYNLHRSADFWENPDTFDPERFDRPFENKGVDGWAGFNPDQGQIYPNEIAADFAYLPFGGNETCDSGSGSSSGSGGGGGGRRRGVVCRSEQTSFHGSSAAFNFSVRQATTYGSSIDD